MTDGDASPSSFYPRQHPLPRIFLTAPAYRPALRTPSFPSLRLFKAEKKKLGPHAKKVSCSLLLFPSLLLVSAWLHAGCATARCPSRQTRRAGTCGAGGVHVDRRRRRHCEGMQAAQLLAGYDIQMERLPAPKLPAGGVRKGLGPPPRSAAAAAGRNVRPTSHRWHA